MNQLLKIGMTVQTEDSARPCRVEQFLGGGGQGEVYRAILDDVAVALKWYFPAQATAQQRRNLQLLIAKGAPTTRFLWPLALAVAPGVGASGQSPVAHDHPCGNCVWMRYSNRRRFA